MREKMKRTQTKRREHKEVGTKKTGTTLVWSAEEEVTLILYYT